MTTFNVGDKSKAICYQCKKMVTTTFKILDVPFSDGIGKAYDVLAGVCDCCEQVVSIPSQSTSGLKAWREKALAASYEKSNS